MPLLPTLYSPPLQLQPEQQIRKLRLRICTKQRVRTLRHDVIEVEAGGHAV